MESTSVYSYPYPHPALTADCAVFGFDGREVKILLIERGMPPYKGYWALPGGFMRIDETVEACARRELLEETGLRPSWLGQVGVYSDPSRDPRERVVTVAFVALVPSHEVTPVAGDDARATAWFALDELPPLAFDHADIINDAEALLKSKIRLGGSVVFKMLNETFTLSQLRLLMEWASGEKQDRRNFERKMMATGMLREIPSANYDAEPMCDMACCSMPSPRQRKRWFAFKSKSNPLDDPSDDQ